MGACCFCACIFKMILGILNMVLMLFGILIAGLGGILFAMSDSTFVKEIIRIIVVPILERLYSKDMITNTVSGNFKEIVGPLSWGLIIIGSILIAIAMFGYIGLSLGVNLCLAIYASAIGIIIFVEIVLLSIFFSGALNQPVDQLLVKSIQDQYGDINDTNIITLSWNLIMMRFHCCGAVGYKDFHGPNKLPKHIEVTISNIKFSETFDMPVFCCKMNGTFPNLDAFDATCVTEGSVNNNKDKGCRKAVSEEIETIKSQFLTFGIFAILIQLAILVMICIVMQENKVFPKSS